MTKRGDTDMDTRRNLLKKKRRVVIKIGSSSLQHTETGDMDYIRLEVLVREPISGNLFSFFNSLINPKSLL